MQRWDACRAISSLTCKQFFFYLWDLCYLYNMFFCLELYSLNLCWLLEVKEMFKCIFNLDPILTCHDKKLPSSDRCFWASFFQPPWAPIPHPPPQLDAVCFLCCFLLIFSLCGASLLVPFHLSIWCISISCFLAQNLPSHPVPRSPENMCAMAQLMFGSFLRSVLLNTGSVSLLTKEGVY